MKTACSRGSAKVARSQTAQTHARPVLRSRPWRAKPSITSALRADPAKSESEIGPRQVGRPDYKKELTALGIRNSTKRSTAKDEGIEGLAFDENGFVQITWAEWERRFRPIRDAHGDIRDFWGVEGVEEFAERDPLCLWTEFQADEEGLAIHSGFCRGNRVAHYYTEFPVPEDLLIEVWDEPSWSEEEVEFIRRGVAAWQAEVGVPPTVIASYDFCEWFIGFEDDERAEELVVWGADRLLATHFPELEDFDTVDDYWEDEGDA